MRGSICFPLTLTLSLEERGLQAVTFDSSKAYCANPVAGLRKRQRRILPLPEGEGAQDARNSKEQPQEIVREQK